MSTTQRFVAAASVGAVIATVHTAYNLTRLLSPVADPPSVSRRVSVLIPARNESGDISECLESVRASINVVDLEVLVLDDGSSDDTAEVVCRHAVLDPRVRLIRGSSDPLPDGWLGKPWACQRLADQATGEILVFLDADVVLAPTGLAATVWLLMSSGLDLVSPYPRQLADGLLPRLVQPLLQWSWLTLLPLGIAQSSQRESLSAANGQLLAITAAAYRGFGGHSAVRADVLDDVALVRALKRAGGRGVVADGTEVATCRMYDSNNALLEGYGKSLWSAFGSPAGSVAAVSLLAMLYVVPPLAALAAPTRRGRAWGAAGTAAAVAGRTLVAARTQQRVFPDVLAHPVSIVAFGGLVAHSWRLHHRGENTWKGRTLPGRPVS